MTKTSIFGQSEAKQEEKRPIEFVKHIRRRDGIIDESRSVPNDFQNITLLQCIYIKDLDLMWAYDESPNQGALFLGRWNDGIVK